MDDLIEFLRARLAEEEATARAATPGPWTADAEAEVVTAAEGVVARIRDFNRAGINAQFEADTKLIAVHADPARVLAEVEAKRTFLDHVEQLRHSDTPLIYGAADEMLRSFAAVYDAHPDYRPEWAPSA